jgi:hypothetical protein
MSAAQIASTATDTGYAATSAAGRAAANANARADATARATGHAANAVSVPNPGRSVAHLSDAAPALPDVASSGGPASAARLVGDVAGKARGGMALARGHLPAGGSAAGSGGTSSDATADIVDTMGAANGQQADHVQQAHAKAHARGQARTHASGDGHLSARASASGSASGSVEN